MGPSLPDHIFITLTASEGTSDHSLFLSPWGPAVSQRLAYVLLYPVFFQRWKQCVRRTPQLWFLGTWRCCILQLRNIASDCCGVSFRSLKIRILDVSELISWELHIASTQKCLLQCMVTALKYHAKDAAGKGSMDWGSHAGRGGLRLEGWCRIGGVLLSVALISCRPPEV